MTKGWQITNLWEIQEKCCFSHNFNRFLKNSMIFLDGFSIKFKPLVKMLRKIWNYKLLEIGAFIISIFFQSPPNDQQTSRQMLGWFLFSVVYLSVCVCITRPGQTTGPIFMKIGTHTHLKVREKWVSQIFDNFFRVARSFFLKKNEFFAVFQHKSWPA